MADYLSKHSGIEIDNSVDKTAELETRLTKLEQNSEISKPEYEYVFQLLANGSDNTTQLNIRFTLRTTKLIEGFVLPIVNQQVEISVQGLIDLIKATYEITSGQFTINNISGGFTTAGFSCAGGKDINLIYNSRLTIDLSNNSVDLYYFNFGYNITITDNAVTTVQENGATEGQLQLSSPTIYITQVLKLK